MKTEGPNDNGDRTAEGRKKGESVKGDAANENVVQPQEQRPKDASSKRQRGNKDKDAEMARVNVSSREFVRGGRGRLRGSARGRGRGGRQDVYDSTSHRDVESASQHGSADDGSNARVASAMSSTTRTNGSEQKRSAHGRTSAQQSKMEDRELSHEAVPTNTDVADQRNVQSPSDDRGNKPQGLLQSDVGNTSAKDTGRRNEISSQTSRRKTEFYDSRNRGRSMRHYDARVNTGRKPQEQRDPTSVKDEAGVAENATTSSQDIVHQPSDKGSNEASSEQTSQRKAGEN